MSYVQRLVAAHRQVREVDEAMSAEDESRRAEGRPAVKDDRSGELNDRAGRTAAQGLDEGPPVNGRRDVLATSRT